MPDLQFFLTLQDFSSKINIVIIIILFGYFAA
jgi:hypothetical protein